MKIRDWLLFLFVLTTTSACKIDMHTDIYLRDIKDVALTNAEGLHTSGLLKIGVPDCNNKEQLSEVTGLLRDYFLKVTEKSCELGMESLLTIGIDIPIINSTQGWSSKTSSTTALVTNKSKDGSSILVDFALNKTKFANLNSVVQSKFFNKLSFDESTVSFGVNNDGRQNEEAVISDSFVDGRPVIYSKRFTLARRNKIDVEPSNVRKISFSESGSMPVLEIPIIDSQKANLNQKKSIAVAKNTSSETKDLNSKQPPDLSAKDENDKQLRKLLDALQQKTKEDCASKSNPSSYPNPIMCPEHIEIMKTFVDNLKNGNIDYVVSHINYPITFYKFGTGKVSINNSEQFKKFYEFIFPKKIIKEIAKNFSNDEGFFWKKGSMMFGRGDIWFDLESGQVITINHTDDILITEMVNTILNIDNMPIGWKTPDGLIPPQCFFKEWMSSDNDVGSFLKPSSTKNDSDFSENPGKYIGGAILLDPIVPDWGGSKVFLAAPYDLCFNGSLEDGYVTNQKTPHVINIDGNLIKSGSTTSALSQYAYSILAKVPQKKCQDLAPNLKGLCRQSFLIELGDDGGGSMGWVYEHNIYGLFSFKNKRQFIVPLKRFNNKKDAINYIDSIK